MLNKLYIDINKKIFQKSFQNLLNKKINSSSIKNFASLAKFDFTDPLKLEDLLTEEERMVNINKRIYSKFNLK
jgi:hypothetical protein